MTATVAQRARRSAPGRLATEVARHGVRAVGTVTSSLRPGPDLLVVGAKRAGTTSVWHYLQQHPGVLPLFPAAEHLKGLYYFDVHYDRGERWYRSHFETAAWRSRLERELGHPTVAAEASPYYLFHPLAAARAHALLPDARVLVLLRDPVERAYSHWKERRRHTETLDFAQALLAEPLRTAGEEERLAADPAAVSFAHRHQTYLAQGCYSVPLQRWFDAYGRDRVEVVVAEDLFAHPQRVVERVWGQMGLPPQPLVDVTAHNSAPSPDMDPAVRRQLRKYFLPETARLEVLLGRTLPWPNT